MSRKLLSSSTCRFARPAASSFLRQSRRTLIVGTSAEGSVINVQQVPAAGSGHVRVLLLNRPEARNALSRQLLSSLSQHVESIRAEKGKGPTRALVLGSSVDAAFCAGADLKERATFTQKETAEFLANLRDTFKGIEQLEIPTISAISSTALGGGLELALATHLRVFGSTAMVGLPETRLAIIPGAGGTYRLPKVVGMNRALDLILTGRRVSAPEAYFMGLCNRLVEVTPEEAAQESRAREKVLAEAIKYALDICEGGPIALTQALRAVTNWEKGEAVENEAYEHVVGTEDRNEALFAFVEKRKPSFKGR
ncbi:hypothetical protein KEM56_001794 [Ascosphaera pollenicola]|nr:hypothetical protein KEM56_001794 [Ascosphaera pollenicola]